MFLFPKHGLSFLCKKMGTVIFCLDYDSLRNTRSLSKSVPQTDVIWYIIKKPKDIY